MLRAARAGGHVELRGEDALWMAASSSYDAIVLDGPFGRRSLETPHGAGYRLDYSAEVQLSDGSGGMVESRA